MSFLDDLLVHDETLAQATVKDDPAVRSLVEAAARDGNVDALRTAMARGQVARGADKELIAQIVGIAGDQMKPATGGRLQERLAFLQEWLNATLPEEPGARQETLDFLLQRCFSSIFHVHEAVAIQLLGMGANPLVKPIITDVTPEVTTEVAVNVGAKMSGDAKNPDQEGVDLAPAGEGVARSLAVIGTAGRDKDKPMTQELWDKMLADARTRVKPTDTLVSGGAAWADHLAVALFLEGRVKALRLHLPAPFKDATFQGPRSSAASAANYYHDLFSRVLDLDTRHQIDEAIAKGAEFTEQPAAAGYGAMFARNKVVAQESSAVLAYTFGEGAEVADGGTKNTWDQIKGGDRTHVPLMRLLQEPAKPDPRLTAEPAPATKAAPTAEVAPVNQVNQVNQVAQAASIEEISGARLGLAQVADSATTLARAIYGQASAACLAQMLKSCPPNDPFPVVATLRFGGRDHQVNALAYAIATAQPKQLDQLLATVDLRQKPQRLALGEAVESVVAMGLADFGPDEVHEGIAKLLAAGAVLKDLDAVTQRQVAMVPSACMKFFDSEGRIVDGETVMEQKAAEGIKRCILPAALLYARKPEVTVGALKSLMHSGWSHEQPVWCNAAASGADPGATIAHYAAMRGDTAVIAALRAEGVDMHRKDAAGRAPVEYAFRGMVPESARLIDTQAAQELERLAAETKAQAPASPTQETRQSHPVPSTPSSTQEDSNPASGKSIDEVNAMLAEASMNDDDIPWDDADYQTTSAAPPATIATPEPKAPAAPPTKAMSRLAAMQQAQAAARARTGKPLDQSVVTPTSTTPGVKDPEGGSAPPSARNLFNKLR